MIAEAHIAEAEGRMGESVRSFADDPEGVSSAMRAIGIELEAVEAACARLAVHRGLAPDSPELTALVDGYLHGFITAAIAARIEGSADA